jgi:steroid delta-isomerase-like uncharacterized protein
MAIHRFDALVLPAAASASRRTLLRRLGAAGFAAATAATSLPRLTQAQTPTAGSAIAEAWTAAWNSHQSAQVAALFTPDGIYEDLAFGLAAHGTDEIAKFADGFFTAAPDLHIDLVAGFGAADWAAAEWVFSGTDTGGVAGKPTGKHFEVRGATIFQMEGDKARRDSDYYNAGTVLEQLGLMPSKSATPAASRSPPRYPRMPRRRDPRHRRQGGGRGQRRRGHLLTTPRSVEAP